MVKTTALKVKFSFKDYIRKHALFWTKTPEYCMFSDVIPKGKLHISCGETFIGLFCSVPENSF